MAPPPTSDEQLALDELLKDIYIGIETFPDYNQASRRTTTTSSTLKTTTTAPKSASTKPKPILDNNNKYNTFHYHSSKQQVKPLAANSNINQQYLDTGTTKRRVRIAEHPEKIVVSGTKSPEEENTYTSWLDKQLNRATRRRTSKDLIERQENEKAMIEELKRNLKNGSLNTLINNNNNPPNPQTRSSPQTPTHQLKAASPSLSPSPINSPISSASYNCDNNNYNYKSYTTPRQQQYQSSVATTTYNSQTMTPTLTSSTTSYHDNCKVKPILRGTRIIPAPAPVPQYQQPQQHQHPYHYPYQSNQPNQPNKQPIYTNQQQQQQQQQLTRTTTSTPGYSHRTNEGSIREFNELDNLLKSLSPTSATTTPIATVRSHEMTNKNTSSPICGTPAAYAEQQQQKQPYSHINKPGFLARPATPGNPLAVQTPSDNILPSMEDYQNIAKLNPVPNHYWYKPNMSRDHAIALLKDKPQGTFIVRDSNSFRGAYGLAVKVAKPPQNAPNSGDSSNELIRHFLIERIGNGVRLKGYANEPAFSSLPNLIYQHSLTELALPTRLIIPRADIEDPDFELKQKQFFKEFLTSKEEAKNLPYKRTSPDGGYRRYPGNVLIHNEHRIIFS